MSQLIYKLWSSSIILFSSATTPQMYLHLNQYLGCFIFRCQLGLHFFSSDHIAENCLTSVFFCHYWAYIRSISMNFLFHFSHHSYSQFQFVSLKSINFAIFDMFIHFHTTFWCFVCTQFFSFFFFFDFSHHFFTCNQVSLRKTLSDFVSNFPLSTSLFFKFFKITT